MKNRSQRLTRRTVLTQVAVLTAALLTRQRTRARAHSVKQIPDYDPHAHRWLIAIDVRRCIGCGLCVEACKKENQVPEGAYYRTWIERYTVTRPVRASGDIYGETRVDSPKGGIDGFPPNPVPKEEILKSFFVPKLCNLCVHSPCAQACPVGATFDGPDGVVLVDTNYCVGCGFCVQACPYGCRFINPVTHTAEKCSLCYHRITKGLKPACVEVCPSHARIFGDVKAPLLDPALEAFMKENHLQVLKGHLGTDPRVLYAGLDREVR